jgi:hypothetical protein
LWKVGAIVKTSVRRIWFHVSATWPARELFVRVYEAIRQFVQSVRGGSVTVPRAGFLPLM